MRGYQRFVYLRGTLLGILLLIGLGGIVRSWSGSGIRRLDDWGGPALYPWLSAMVLLLAPVMTADYSQRYVLISMPAACLAAGLAFASRTPDARPGEAGEITRADEVSESGDVTETGPQVRTAGPHGRPR
jgi:hypothetical protein